MQNNDASQPKSSTNVNTDETINSEITSASELLKQMLLELPRPNALQTEHLLANLSDSLTAQINADLLNDQHMDQKNEKISELLEKLQTKLDMHQLHDDLEDIKLFIKFQHDLIEELDAAWSAEKYLNLREKALNNGEWIGQMNALSAEIYELATELRDEQYKNEKDIKKRDKKITKLKEAATIQELEIQRLREENESLKLTLNHQQTAIKEANHQVQTIQLEHSLSKSNLFTGQQNHYERKLAKKEEQLKSFLQTVGDLKSEETQRHIEFKKKEIENLRNLLLKNKKVVGVEEGINDNELPDEITIPTYWIR